MSSLLDKDTEEMNRNQIFQVFILCRAAPGHHRAEPSKCTEMLDEG